MVIGIELVDRIPEAKCGEDPRVAFGERIGVGASAGGSHDRWDHGALADGRAEPARHRERDGRRLGLVTADHAVRAERGGAPVGEDRRRGPDQRRQAIGERDRIP
jgi:hypothetical protein